MVHQFSKRTSDDVSVVLVGLEPDGSLDRNARRMCEECVRSGLNTFRVDYDDLDAIPRLTLRPEVLVMLFFPHRFWDANCETPGDTGLYGTSMRSYNLFRDFCLDVEARLERLLAGRRIAYLVPPGRAFADRDKVETVRTLSAAGVATPLQYETRDAGELLDRIEPGRGIFVKCRYGAEGKGISYLSRAGWWTNYRVDGGRLGNYGIHDRWQFTEITGRKDLLSELLANEVIVEREIVTPEIGRGTKFDVRVYVSAGAAPHMFLRINRRDGLVTNFSQGGTTEHRYDEIMPEAAIDEVRRTGLAASRALECPFIGVDVMFEQDGSLVVVETQVFTDFPDIRYFSLPAFVIRQIRAGAWRVGR
jgi:hypothetical protein